MRTALEQATLAARVETGAAREFRVWREDTWYPPKMIKLSQLRHLSQALPSNALLSSGTFCFGVRLQAPDSC